MSATNRIIDQLVPEWIDHQSRKAIDYNSRKAESGMDFEPAEVLGVKGQFAEVWRKIWKLKKAMWDGEELLQEQPREILLDLIGHCFLAIDMLDRQQMADPPMPSPARTIRDVTGHRYDGCPICVRARTEQPELIV